MNLTSISAGIVVIVTLAILIFLIFARRQIMDAFFPNRGIKHQTSALSVDQLLTRAYARRDTGDTRGALRDFEEVLRRAPTHPEAPNIKQEITRLR